MEILLLLLILCIVIWTLVAWVRWRMSLDARMRAQMFEAQTFRLNQTKMQQQLDDVSRLAVTPTEGRLVYMPLKAVVDAVHGVDAKKNGEPKPLTYDGQRPTITEILDAQDND